MNEPNQLVTPFGPAVLGVAEDKGDYPELDQVDTEDEGSPRDKWVEVDHTRIWCPLARSCKVGNIASAAVVTAFMLTPRGGDQPSQGLLSITYPHFKSPKLTAEGLSLRSAMASLLLNGTVPMGMCNDDVTSASQLPTAVKSEHLFKPTDAVMLTNFDQVCTVLIGRPVALSLLVGIDGLTTDREGRLPVCGKPIGSYAFCAVGLRRMYDRWYIVVHIPGLREGVGPQSSPGLKALINEDNFGALVDAYAMAYRPVKEQAMKEKVKEDEKKAETIQQMAAVTTTTTTPVPKPTTTTTPVPKPTTTTTPAPKPTTTTRFAPPPARGPLSPPDIGQ